MFCLRGQECKTPFILIIGDPWPLQRNINLGWKLCLFSQSRLCSPNWAEFLDLYTNDYRFLMPRAISFVYC